MRTLLAMLVALALFTSLALAQGTMTGDVTTVPASPSTLTFGACPVPQAALPQPCPALVASNYVGGDVVLVLGTEEHFALSTMAADEIGWRDYSFSYQSIFDPRNPLSSHQPNPVVRRGGNPFYPYHIATADLRVPAVQTRTVTLPATLPAADRQTLASVSQRYRTMTPSQAMALGYQPVSGCAVGQGQLFVNTALVDNRFDPMQPEAFTFGPDGRVLSAQYIVVSPTPLTMWGQTTTAMPLYPGTQTLTAWVFEPNPNGFFAATNPTVRCALL